ncbi:MAG: peptidase M61 [Flavobacterium sp.]|nr:MAG: peptidase M61 [Flavobacterium sp.]
MKSIITFFTALLIGSTLLAQKNTDLPKTSKTLAIESNIGTIEASIDLTKIVDDKAPVTIIPERFKQDTVIYRMPKVIPGTYAISDFGNFIDDFKAYDKKGREMDFTKKDENSWMIPNATKLRKITYLVNDTFDVENTKGIATPFSPSGTNIEGNNCLLNLHGFIGYFEGFQNNQYQLEIVSESKFNRASALQQVGEEFSKDSLTAIRNYYAARYFDITDNPIMYGDFETEEFQVGDIKVVLSVYSPNKIYKTKDFTETIYKMMEAQKEYLGDINSTARYDVFLYLSEMNETSPSGFGALEHHTSTVVVMPESMPIEALESSMIDIVSHEFFHIVTPLTIHSEDVHYFDYYEPTFSKHLWLYEGITEYFATHFQIHQGLVSEKEFYTKIMSKIQNASIYDDTMSFTEMSENVIASPYQENYANVYEKGALIGMCLDIMLREESDGQRGILSLMKELSLKYGKNLPFEDDKLFDEIVEMTYPSLREFFDNHVIGNTPIDYEYYFEIVGLEFSEGLVETNYIMNNGALILEPNANGTITFTDMVLENSFWKEQGALPGDVIAVINGTPVSMESAEQIFTEVYMWEPGPEVEVKLLRGDEDIIIKTELTQSYTKGNGLQPVKDASAVKLEIRDSWLKG